MDLSGKFLIAMPAMGDPRFERSVVLICSHSDEGSMGLIVNKPMPDLAFSRLLDQIGIAHGDSVPSLSIQYGGPVEPGRGFVLHGDGWASSAGTMKVPGGMAMTATQDVLEALARGTGPAQAFLALGYAGWGPGQLDAELADSAWLIMPVELDLIFEIPPNVAWEMAIRRLGADPHLLQQGHGVH